MNLWKERKNMAENENFYKEGYWDWYKIKEEDSIWWSRPKGEKGKLVFTFDKKTVFNFWSDFPDKLTPEQIEIFKKTNPILARVKIKF